MTAGGQNGREALCGLLRDALPIMRDVGVHPTDDVLPGEVGVGALRRRRLRRGEEESQFLTLVRGLDGVLRWETDAGPSSYTPSRRAARRRAAEPAEGDIVEEFKYRPLEGSQVGQLLDRLDNGFNPERGLRQLTAAGWQPVGAVPVAKGRILLFVHGTFSKADTLRAGLAATPEGRTFLSDALRDYDQVLAFEHPTLSVSPFLNALDLARAFANTAAKIDVVCHSRGGLVTRWWLEALNANSRLSAHVVFVASPLWGTSLAAPDRLRRALNLLTNVVDATRTAADMAALAVPLLGVISGLMRLVGSASRAIAGTPVVDAAVAMIPGLVAQSRMENNFERQRLGIGLRKVPLTYAAVRSNFEPKAPGWHFWEYFVRPGQRIADAGADAVFVGPNDLVVDTVSMTELSEKLAISGSKCICDFGTSATVHHLNYFSQKETVGFLARQFGG
jgi:hypothetical protein